MNGIVQILHVKENACQIQQYIRIGGHYGQRFTETFDGLPCVAFDAPKVANLIVQLHRSWIIFACFAQSTLQRGNVELLQILLLLLFHK